MAQLNLLLRHIQEMAALRGGVQGTDDQLLQDFAARRDEAAFSALVARHGSMVLRVCQRVLHNEHDAEDAFQATFLILAQFSGSIRKQEALANWLHGVAYRTAMKAKRTAARRRNHEARLRELTPGRAASPTWDDVQVVLDEEIQRLPDASRAVFVHCVLEGKSGSQTAAELGIKEGSVWTRLTRARQLLQRRLTRRGIKLAAVLAVLSVSSAARAGVPAVLVNATVRFGLLVAAGNSVAAVVPSRVAALATGAARAMFFSKGKIASAVLIAAGLFAIGGGALLHAGLATKERTPPTHKAKPLANQEVKPQAAKPDDPQDFLTFSGRVLDPEGKPFAGAALLVCASAAKKAPSRPRDTTDKDGRFRITVRRTDLEQQAVLVVTAKGFGPDWADLTNSIPKDREISLRLARDDVPINGRLLNLEGRGIAGAEIRVRRMEKRQDDGDLAAFIATKRQWARGNYVRGRAMKNLGTEALSMVTSATTDPDGRFRLTDFGRERVVHLLIRGEAIETAYVEVLTHTGPVTGLFTGNENDTAYGATFERVCAPSKPIVGTVREKGNSNPLAGVTVFCGRFSGLTDGQGRYRINGIRKQRDYTVTAQGPPYFAATKSQVVDTPEFEPLRVDFDLERGIAIRGRLFDKATGKPVLGIVTYHAFADNPHLKDVSRLDQNGYDHSAGGFFAVTGVPGPGILEVHADEDDYLKVPAAADWKLVPGIITAPPVAHAYVRIDPSEIDPKSITFDIALASAATVKASVIGADGKPLGGYFVAGLTASPRNNSSWRMPQESPTFTVRGLDGRCPRTVVVYSAERKLGKALTVRGDEAGTITVRLEPLSSLTGRVLDADGRPCVGAHVEVTFSGQGDNGARLPVQFFITRGTWAAKLEGKGTTDDDGRFRLGGLLPGLKYTLRASEDESADPERLIVQRDGISPPAAGLNEDLGDLRRQKSK